MTLICVQDFESEEIQRDSHVIQSDHDGGYNNHNVFVRNTLQGGVKYRTSLQGHV